MLFPSFNHARMIVPPRTRKAAQARKKGKGVPAAKAAARSRRVTRKRWRTRRAKGGTARSSVKTASRKSPERKERRKRRGNILMVSARWPCSHLVLWLFLAFLSRGKRLCTTARTQKDAGNPLAARSIPSFMSSTRSEPARSAPSRWFQRKAIPVPWRWHGRPSLFNPCWRTKDLKNQANSAIFPRGPDPGGAFMRSRPWTGLPLSRRAFLISSRKSGATQQSASRTTTMSGGSSRRARTPKSRAYPLPRLASSLLSTVRIPWAEATSPVRSVQLSSTTRTWSREERACFKEARVRPIPFSSLWAGIRTAHLGPSPFESSFAVLLGSGR